MQRPMAFILVNKIQYPQTLKNNIYHSNKRVPPLFFLIGYQSCVWPWPSGCNSGIDLVFTLEYTFFRLCSNVEQISVWLARFRRSYVKRPLVVLTRATSYAAFLLDVHCVVQSGHVLFFPLFVPDDSVFAQTIFAEHTTCSHVVNSKEGKQKKDVTI